MDRDQLPSRSAFDAPAGRSKRADLDDAGVLDELLAGDELDAATRSSLGARRERLRRREAEQRAEGERWDAMTRDERRRVLDAAAPRHF